MSITPPSVDDSAASLVVDSTLRLFRDLGEPRLAGAEQRERLWRELDSSGLTRAWVPEALNGSGAQIADGFEILRIAGMHAVAVPLAETLLGSWLLAGAALPSPEGILTVAQNGSRDRLEIDRRDRLSGELHHVPFAGQAEQLVLLARRDDRWFAAQVALADCDLDPGASIAGESRDTVKLRAVAPQAVSASVIDARTFRMMGAAVRAIQIAGALQSVLEMSVDYANERVAFERPIGKFQAIQHSLARLAGETAAAMAAAGSAADAIATTADFDAEVLLEVASAKIRAGEAVTTAAAIAHQVHGAIGFSREHALHRYTQRLWSWRDDFGTECEWAVELGGYVAARGADALWPLLASR